MGRRAPVGFLGVCLLFDDVFFFGPHWIASVGVLSANQVASYMRCEAVYRGLRFLPRAFFDTFAVVSVAGALSLI